MLASHCSSLAVVGLGYLVCYWIPCPAEQRLKTSAGSPWTEQELPPLLASSALAEYHLLAVVSSISLQMLWLVW